MYSAKQRVALIRQTLEYIEVARDKRAPNIGSRLAEVTREALTSTVRATLAR